MGPIDPRVEQAGVPENSSLGIQAADSKLKTRVVVEIYPWHPNGIANTDQVEPPPADRKTNDPEPPQK